MSHIDGLRKDFYALYDFMLTGKNPELRTEQGKIWFATLSNTNCATIEFEKILHNFHNQVLAEIQKEQQLSLEGMEKI